MLNFIRAKKLYNQIEQRREKLYRLAFSWCHDEMLADDLVQDTLGKALKKYHQLKDQQKLDPWLYRILHNCWMAHLRHEKPATILDDVNNLDENSPDRILSDEQLVKRVRLAVSCLPVLQRQVISLVDLEGCCYADVADILEIPIGTVMSRLNRARASLRKKLISIESAQFSVTPQLRSVK